MKTIFQFLDCLKTNILIGTGNFLNVLDYWGVNVSYEAFKMAFMDVSSGKFRMNFLVKNERTFVEDFVLVLMLTEQYHKIVEFMGFRGILKEYEYVFQMLDYFSKKKNKLKHVFVQGRQPNDSKIVFEENNLKIKNHYKQKICFFLKKYKFFKKYFIF